MDFGHTARRASPCQYHFVEVNTVTKPGAERPPTTSAEGPSAPTRAPAAERSKPAVGRQVKRWRTERGLTLAQVAERSGLNAGT
jgi:hypothetical protein